LRTHSKKLALLGPAAGAVTGERGTDAEITLVVRSEEGILSSAYVGAQVLPAPPDSVAVSMAFFLFGVEDKAAVCSI
jgi:hypothetical protein